MDVYYFINSAMFIMYIFNRSFKIVKLTFQQSYIFYYFSTLLKNINTVPYIKLVIFHV